MDIVHKWCYFCSITECVFGEHWLQEPMPIMSNGKQYVVFGHRHDQRIRHKLPTVLKTWDFYEFRSLEHAQKNNSLFYNHHGGYENIQL